MTQSEFPEIGILGFPWLFALPVVLVVGLYVYRHRGNLRKAIFGRFTSRGQWISFLVVLLYVNILLLLSSSYDPIGRGTVYAPGPGIDSVGFGEIYPFDEGSVGLGDGPLYRTSVGPGQEFRVLTSIRNKGPVPITLLGPTAASIGASTPGVVAFISGVWLAKDAETGAFPSSSTLTPFEPTPLGPGEQVPVVLVFTGGTCADPAGNESRGIRGREFVYELGFWHRVGVFWPQYEISVRADFGCMSAGRSTNPP